jgi:hypothetical protein
VLAIGGLSSLALAQPVYDLLRRTPEFFAIRDLYVGDLLVFILLLAVGPTFALSAPAIVARLLRPSWTHAAIATPVGLLSAVIALQAIGELHPAIVLAAVPPAAVAATWAYIRFSAARAFAQFLAVAIVIVPLVLVSDSGIRRSVAVPSPAMKIDDTGARAPIVLAIFDEWSLTSVLDPEGAIDRRRLPNLARFADQATWYPNATSPGDSTNLAVSSILTGSQPDRNRLPTVAEHPVNLFTELAPSHDVYALEPVTSLCPPDVNHLAKQRPPLWTRLDLLVSDLSLVWLTLTLPAPWAEHLPPVTQVWSGFGRAFSAATPPRPQNAALHRAVAHLDEADRAHVFRSFIDEIGPPGQRPDFHFVHSMLPHSPYEYLPSGGAYPFGRGRTHGLDGSVWSTEPWPSRHQRQRYLLQVGFVDALLGELISRLESTGRFDKSLIVIAADHGVSFVPGRSRRIPDLDDPSGHQVLDIAAVPLLIKAPFQREARIDRTPLSLADLKPQLLQLAGAPSESSAPGKARDRLILVSEESGLVEIPPDREPWRRARLAELATLLGEAGDPLAVGVRPDLHGHRVSELPYRQSERSVRLQAVRTWDDVNLDRPEIPVLVHGSFDRPGQATNQIVVVALNGTVGATVRSSRRNSGGDRFSAMLPEAMFRSGLNQIDVFLISERSDSLELEHLQRAPGFAYELARGESVQADALVRRSRSATDATVRIPIQARSATDMIGYVENAHRPGAEIHGWALELGDSGSPLEVVAFLDGRQFWIGTTSGKRERVAERFGEEHLYSGFSQKARADSGLGARAASETLATIRRQGFLVYAVSERGMATRLPFFYAPLEEEDGEEILPISDGRRLPVLQTGDRFAGAVDLIAKSTKPTLIAGWTADLERGERPRQVVVYGDGKLVAALGANHDRPAVADQYDNLELLRTGFRGAVPGAPDPTTLADRHRVFALMPSGSAVELPIRTAPETDQ